VGLAWVAQTFAAGLNAGSAHRQLARSLGCAPSTVTRLAARLGRHAPLLSALLLDPLDGIREPVVFDHFESFARHSGREGFLVRLRDRGRHAAPRGQAQPGAKARRKALKTSAYARPGAYGRSVRETLDRLLQKVEQGDLPSRHTRDKCVSISEQFPRTIGAG
jgi:hypothetical protein